MQPDGSSGFDFYYYLRDHLGNTRLIVQDANSNGSLDVSEIVQENHYYPFGMQMQGDWMGSSVDNYTYNGKEWNDDFGLDWLDYGARWYDASIGRWNAVDPLAEDFVSWTPYNYVYNNPLIFIDPDGRAGNLADGATIYFQNSGDLDDEDYRRAVHSYIMNVISVWVDGNSADFSNVTFRFAEDGFSKKDLGENENLVEFGNTGTSEVKGGDNQLGFINVNDIQGNSNVAAHEFGHHLGLADRYDEGVKRNQSTGDISRETTRITNSRIADPDYNPSTNLYAGPSVGATITPQQMRIASTNTVEPRHQINGGYYYNVNTDGNVISRNRYRNFLGIIFGKFPAADGRATRRKIKKVIRSN